MTILNVYGLDTSSGGLGALSASHPDSIFYTRHNVVGRSTGWSEVWAGDNSNNWQSLSAIGAPTDHGWWLNNTSLEGQQILAGTWSPSVSLSVGIGDGDHFTGDLWVRAWVRHSNGSKTAIGSWSLTGQVVTNNRATYSLTPASTSAASFGVGDKLYIDFWVNVTSNSVDEAGDYLFNYLSHNGIAHGMELDTPGFSPSNPILSTNPTTLSFSAVVGGSNPGTQNSNLNEIGGTATAWTSSISYAGTGGWLGIVPTSGSLGANGSQGITYTATTGSLPQGTYQATVTYTATTGGAIATVVVTFKLINPATPALSISPVVLPFSDQVSTSSPPGQNMVLSETGGTTTAWTSSINYIIGTGWLSLSPTSGTLVALGSATIPISVVTGALAVGTYLANITFTATTGGAIAILSVQFVVTPPPAPPPPPNVVLMAGQNITLHVDQFSMEIVDTLGQGPGEGSAVGTQGRASTIKFNTDLGPIGTAVGAGGFIPVPGYTGYETRTLGGDLSLALPDSSKLVRQGEIIVTDVNGTIVFGGFVTKLTDITMAPNAGSSVSFGPTTSAGASATSGAYFGLSTKAFTQVDGIDYGTSLARVMINTATVPMTDVQLIKLLVSTYAPWISLSQMPASGIFNFPAQVYRNISLEQAIQSISTITGYLIWVDYQKTLHYALPSGVSSSPYSISDQPNFVTSFPAAITEYSTDDNAAINRVFFEGGAKISSDFTQELTPQTSATQTVFALAYKSPVFPTSDGHYHVTVAGVEQVLGLTSSSGAIGQFISQGGLAQVLLDTSNNVLTFDQPPGAGITVIARYRFSAPLVVVTTDEASHKFFGSPYLDGRISDPTVTDFVTATQRSRVLLTQQSFGLTILKFDAYQPGLQAGQVIPVANVIRGINTTFLIQEVRIDPLGAGQYVYHLSCGAWNWNMVDILVKLAAAAQQPNLTQSETAALLILQQVQHNVSVHTSAFCCPGLGYRGTPLTGFKQTRLAGPYYARSTFVGDSHDAYAGFSTVILNRMYVMRPLVGPVPL